MARWKNAPVVYVIVQVRFSPVLSLQTYVSQIQEHFRKNGFPAFSQRFNFQLAVSLGGPGEGEVPAPGIPVERTLGYVFSNREGNQSFVLEQNGLTFHVTEYVDFSWFLDLFLEQLNQINTVVSPDSSTRIGLRYIDAVLPQQGKEVQDYLIPGVLGLSQGAMKGALQHCFSETMVQFGATSTVARIMVRNGQIAFPPDMLSSPVPVNQRFLQHQGPHATIDTDSFQSISAPMDIAKVRETLAQLHDSVDEAFNLVITDFARSDWK